MQNLFNIDSLNVQILENENLSKHCTYKIGGPAKYFITVNDTDSLVAVIGACKDNNLRWFIIGGGSNFLFSDDGFDGAVIKLDGQFKNIEFDKSNKICLCGCGVIIQNLVNAYLENSYTGLEFLAGIPGTIGGAIKMNAGRKTLWISSVVQSVTVLNNQCKIENRDADQIDWGYRYTSFDNDEIILNATLSFEIAKSSEDLEQAKAQISEYNIKRKQNQPLDKASCGSVFKNPENNSAGRLIEEAGLSGKEIGGAQISSLHSNFIVNNGGATANDVISLIRLSQQTVLDKFNVKLIPEVKFLGFKECPSLF